MTSTKKTLRATFAAIAAATLTMTATPAVFAQETTTTPTVPPAATTGDVAYDKSQASVDGMPEEANLVIHKSTLPEGEKGDGTRLDGKDGKENKEGQQPVEGVKFTVYRLTNDAWDLTKNEGWKKASAAAESFNQLDAAARAEAIKAGTWENGPETPAKVTKVNTYITNDKGEIDTGKLPRGIYGVIELDPEDASAYTEVERAAIKVNGDSLGEKTLDRAMPFVVVLPMTDQDDTSKWLNTVNVYPKNSTSGIEKAVSDSKTPGTGSGDQTSRISYTVTTDVPKGYVLPTEVVVDKKATGKQTLKSYQIADNLHKKVHYDGGTKLQIIGGATPFDLVVGEHYELMRKVYDEGEMLLVTFKPAGLEKLITEAKQGERKVQWTFDAQVGALDVKDGFESVPNTAYLIPPNRPEGNWIPEGCVEDEEPAAEGQDPKLPGDVTGGTVEDPNTLPDGTPKKEGEDGSGTAGKPGGPANETNEDGTPKGPQDGKRRGEETGKDGADKDKPVLPSDEKTDKTDGGKTKTKKCEETPRPTPPGPKAEVESRYGKVIIDKFAKGEETKKLPGATFRLYTCNSAMEITDYTNNFESIGEKVVNGKIPAKAKPVKVNGATEWATDAEGKVEISGLQLNDWNNDASTKENAKVAAEKLVDRKYCLVEVAAPKGYELLPEAIQFQLLSDSESAEVGPIVTQHIANVPNDLGFNLPLTGGKGVLPLIALGGLLVVGAGGYAAVAAKRNRKEA